MRLMINMTHTLVDVHPKIKLVDVPLVGQSVSEEIMTDASGSRRVLIWARHGCGRRAHI